MTKTTSHNVHFEELSLGETFLSGGRSYLKTDDSCARALWPAAGEHAFTVGAWEIVERIVEEG